MKDPRDVILRPVVSEKSYALLEENTYTFEVHPSSSKPEIKDAVESIFDVAVLKVEGEDLPVLEFGDSDRLPLSATSAGPWSGHRRRRHDKPSNRRYFEG